MKNINVLFVLTLLILLVAVSQMAQTIYIPGIPQIANELQVQNDDIQWVMSTYLLFYGLSQLFYGPISDKIGRKLIILIGMGIFSTGSILAFFSKTLYMLIFSRIVQGIGAGVCGVMSRTLPRDICSDMQNLQNMNSLISMYVLICPILSPLFGGVLINFFGWRACFLFSLLFSLSVSLLICLFLPETKRKQRDFKKKCSDFYQLLIEKKFNRYLLMLIGGLSGIVAFETNGGTLLSDMNISEYKISVLFILPLQGIFIGTFYVNQSKKSFKELMWIAVTSCFISGILIWVPYFFANPSIWMIFFPIIIFFFGAGILFPLATTGAMQGYPHLSGTAGALIGGLQNLGSSIVSVLFSYFFRKCQINLGIATFSMGTLVLISWISLLLKDKK